MAKFRITIEYEIDNDDPLIGNEALLEKERQDWITGGCDMGDVIAVEGESAVKFEILP